jgi:hypothetical protein
LMVSQHMFHVCVIFWTPWKSNRLPLFQRWDAWRPLSWRYVTCKIVSVSKCFWVS